MGMPEVVLAHQTVIDGDAIGHDMFGMYQTLTGLGYNVGYFSEYSSGKAKSLQIKPSKIRSIFENKDSILIYHHSIHWDGGEKLLTKFKGKIIFKYHNITPPQYYSGFSSLYYDKCRQGFTQTKRLVEKYQECLWWGDSIFNVTQLQGYGLNLERSLTVPPFHLLSEFKGIEPRYHVIDTLIDNNCNNILFVGRVVPNKGHKHLIEIIKVYKEEYDRNVHLWIVGSLDQPQLQLYYTHLVNLIRQHNLQKNISFTDKLPIGDIKAYYLGCDAFLCMSEHEGFCVPIIEAQQLGLPLVTYGGTALGETTGKNQIVLEDFDYDFAASALYTIYTDERVKRFCRRHGIMNVNSRFSAEQIRAKFISAFEQSIAEVHI